MTDPAGLHRLSVGDVELAWRLDGRADAPLLVLSNSLGTELSMWAPQIDTLTARFRVLRYDSRGHGVSSAPAGPYSIAQMGRDVLALVAHIGAQRANFCGISMGGMVGLWLGIHAPAQFERIVVTNTAARIGPLEAWNTRIAKVRESGMAGIAEAVLARWFTPAFLAANPTPVQRARRMLLATSPRGYVASCEAVRDADLRDDVGRIGACTLVIAGSRDPVTTPADARYLVEHIDGARYCELDAPHISNLEQPTAFTAALVDFLTT